MVSGERGAERCRAVFGAWLVEVPPLRFLAMSVVVSTFWGGDAVAMRGRSPTTASFGGTSLSRRLFGRWTPVEVVRTAVLKMLGSGVNRGR